MSYLSHYRVGDPLFRTLSECRMRFDGLVNRFRYPAPPPRSTTSIPFDNLLELPNGHVLGDGSCLTADGESLIEESTLDFHRKTEFHHLLSARRIPEPETIDATVAVVASPGSDNYFHWTLSALPRIARLVQSGKDYDFIYANNAHSFHREWLGLLGIPESKILPARTQSHFQAKRLLIPAFKDETAEQKKNGVRFVQSFIPATDPQKHPRRIFISRKHARRRKLIGEDRLFSFLRTRGFVRIFPGKLSVREQMELFRHAETIISPHGAELTNLVYCQPGTKVIELLSPRYLNPCFRNLANQCGLDYQGITPRGAASFSGQIGKCWVWNNIPASPAQVEALLN